MFAIFSLEHIWKDFWAFTSTSYNDNEGEDEGHSLDKSNSIKVNHPVNLVRKMNGTAADETHLYTTDLDEKKLEIVEDDVDLGKNYLGRLGSSTNNNSEPTKKKSNLKIGGKFVLKFRALMEFDYVQFFIQEADFAFYQYIVEFLIPKVCSSF